jgi:hypothetical protein
MHADASELNDPGLRAAELKLAIPLNRPAIARVWPLVRF